MKLNGETLFSCVALNAVKSNRRESGQSFYIRTIDINLFCLNCEIRDLIRITLNYMLKRNNIRINVQV